MRVRGLGELQATLRDIAGDLAAAEAAAARIIAPAARAAAPKRSGLLAASVHAEGASVRASAPYAGVIHNGWPAHNISPSPFVRTGAERTQDQWLGEFVRVLEDGGR